MRLQLVDVPALHCSLQVQATEYGFAASQGEREIRV
jgi:hypothetical protein